MSTDFYTFKKRFIDTLNSVFPIRENITELSYGTKWSGILYTEERLWTNGLMDIERFLRKTYSFLSYVIYHNNFYNTKKSTKYQGHEYPFQGWCTSLYCRYIDEFIKSWEMFATIEQHYWPDEHRYKQALVDVDSACEEMIKGWLDAMKADIYGYVSS